MNDVKGLIKSFGYAFRGIFTAIKKERNMRIHTVCMVYMYFFLFAFDFFEITRTQLAVLLLATGLVLGGELINTAVENAVDLFGNEHTEYGKIAKDCAAGAVLIFAIFSVLCGIAVMWQPEAFSQLFAFFADKLWAVILFVLSLILSIVFIFFDFSKTKKN